ncbi:TonB-dependent receptor [Hyphomicrobium sp.]|uniref:TonB-dependent receptor family protein n=1 Tax=Hyphomicrobium sp. TaxID=82 RepID=UPI0025BE949B|nr:TonB-dependent receptor [Hyphomicrobium sp.]
MIALLMCSTSVMGQSAAPGATVELPAVVVEGSAPAPKKKKKAASPTSSAGVQAATATGSAPEESSDGAGSAAAEAARKLDAIAGGTSVVANEDISPKASASLSEMLAFVPGVVVQNFFGGNDQPRLQIRRSGLQQNPSERGTLVLQDGLPINRADGSYIVGFADPKSAAFAEIYRGYTANRLGATVLGGAINFVSPTGITSPGAEVTVEGGSFGHFATHAQAGAQQGNFDAHASLSYTERDGYREHNESERTNFNLNAGARVNDNISTRLFFGYTDLSFDVVGPLSRDLLEQNPKQTCSGPPFPSPVPAYPLPAGSCRGPNVLRDDPHREAEQFRIGSRTTARSGADLFDVALGYTYTDDSFTFPVGSGVRDTEGGDFTAVARYAYAPHPSRALPLFELTGQYVVGSTDRDYFINARGKKGALFGENEFDSTTLSIHTGFNVPLTERLTVSPAIAYSYASRENADVFAGASRPRYNAATNTYVASLPFADTSYDHSYQEWTPSLGLTYDLARNQSLFAAVSRSFEPPTHDDLIAAIQGSPHSSAGTNPSGATPALFSTPDLDAQTATTLEGGWKGSTRDFAWSAIAYYSWVEDELLNLRDASGNSLGAINADKTTHFGIELGAAVDITTNLSGRAAYTYQDFRFDGDANHGDNRLAGAPRHIVNAALRYTFIPGLWLEAEVNWVPDETPVDNANTLFNEAYTVVDLRSNYDITESISIFGEVANVFDEKYASATLIVDSVQYPDQAVFLPGDGRAFIVGAKAKF